MGKNTKNERKTVWELLTEFDAELRKEADADYTALLVSPCGIHDIRRRLNKKLFDGIDVDALQNSGIKFETNVESAGSPIVIRLDVYATREHELCKHGISPRRLSSWHTIAVLKRKRGSSGMYYSALDLDRIKAEYESWTVGLDKLTPKELIEVLSHFIWTTFNGSTVHSLRQFDEIASTMPKETARNLVNAYNKLMPTRMYSDVFEMGVDLFDGEWRKDLIETVDRKLDEIEDRRKEMSK